MFRYKALEVSQLQTASSFDPLTGKTELGQIQLPTKAYSALAYGTLPVGIIFQTEECGKQWLAIDRHGHFWSSYGDCRDAAARWLLKRVQA